MLAKIDQLPLLSLLFENISIPPAVYRELMAKRGAESQRLDAAFNQYIDITREPDLSASVRVVTQHLDAGEQQAIALAHNSSTLLVIDERLGRQAARQIGLTITGSVGLLVRAKKLGHLSAVAPLLQQARQQGYWLSDDLITTATRLAGE
ncbi:MAG: DUF3368 domain-containing protein [Anaerolineales bacterium]|nr:DUF3368 domain-containing protein [Anaerolineales bacterium]